MLKQHPYLAIHPVLRPFLAGPELLQLHSRQPLQRPQAVVACPLVPEGQKQGAMASEEDFQPQFLQLVPPGHDGYNLHAYHHGVTRRAFVAPAAHAAMRLVEGVRSNEWEMVRRGKDK